MNTDIERVRALGLPLLKVGPRSKIPCEEWRNYDHYNRDLKEFEGYNVGVKCGTRIGGQPDADVLHILDIDVRTGGFEALKILCEDYDFIIPETFTVKTGSGGLHYYFRYNEALGKCKLLEGLDFQGVGSYCVGPGSIHENGNSYFIELDDDIAPMPQGLLQAVMEKTGGNQPFFDGKIGGGHFTDDDEVILEGGRDNYLTQLGGYLRRGGLGQAAIRSSLSITNQQKCKPPLSEDDIGRISNSVCKYEPKETFTYDISTVAPEPKKPLQYEGDLLAKSLHTKLKSIFDRSEGLVRSISEHILNHSDRPYYEFAMASAMAVIASVSQGGYQLPSFGRGRSHSSLSNYFWLIGPSASGKDAYRHATETYIGAVDDRLLFNRIGSNYGLRASLFCSNSGISVIDEFQDELDRLGGNKSATYLIQVLTEFKELANDLKELKPVVLSKNRYPGVKIPRYSIFALGTVEGFLRQLSSNFIGGGLLSRFSVWPIFEVPSRLFQDRMEYVPEDQLAVLKDIYKTGVTEAGHNQDYMTELGRFHQAIEGKLGGVEHVPQYDPSSFILKIEPSAKMKLIDFYASQEKLYMKYVKTNLAGSDISPGSIVDRAPRLAYKIAGWHCLGRGSVTISENDVSFGCDLAKALTDWLSYLVSGNSGVTDLDRICNKIMAVVADFREPFTRRDLYRATGNHIKGNEMSQALEVLALGSKIQVLEKKTLRPLEIDTVLPTKGILFAPIDWKSKPVGDSVDV